MVNIGDEPSRTNVFMGNVGLRWWNKALPLYHTSRYYDIGAMTLIHIWQLQWIWGSTYVARTCKRSLLRNTYNSSMRPVSDCSLHVIPKKKQTAFAYKKIIYWMSKYNYTITPHDMTTLTQIARFMGPTWGHLGPVGPRWAPCWPHEP